MSYIAMTTHTLQRLFRNKMLDCADRRCMTIFAVLLGDSGIKLSNMDVFRIVVKCEGKAVVETVDAFDDPLVKIAVGSVTVIARRHRLVRRVAPPIELLAHDMAVHAGVWIIREVGEAFGVNKGEGAKPHQHAKHQRKTCHPVTAAAGRRTIVGHSEALFQVLLPAYQKPQRKNNIY